MSKTDYESYVIFEPPSSNSIEVTNDTEGYESFILSNGNQKFNRAIDNMTCENTNIEDREKTIEYLQTLFAMKALENVKQEINQINAEIKKYTEIKENLRRKIEEL